MLTWSWIIQITFISIILIFLIHHLINFFKSVLTVPKIKDLVNSPKQKYRDIYNIISSSDTSNNNSNNINNSNITYNLEDIIPSNNNEPNMKTELKNFIKKQLNDNSDNNMVDGSTNIQSLQSTIDSNYSFI